VLYAHELGLVPSTTPAYSPESHGLAEAFVGTFKRDYLGDADLRDAETVLVGVAPVTDLGRLGIALPARRLLVSSPPVPPSPGPPTATARSPIDGQRPLPTACPPVFALRLGPRPR